MKIQRMVVGVDGSDNARRAVDWAAGLAALVDAEVIAVHSLGLLEHDRQDIKRLFEQDWCAPLSAPGVRSRCELRDGNPVDVLLAAGEEFDADVLVLGSRGLGGFPEQLLGSTSTQVAQHARRPVVIVPHD